MIAKIVTGRDFLTVHNYAAGKGHLIACNMAADSYSPDRLGRDMALYATCRRDVTTPMLHVALGLPLQDAVRAREGDFISLTFNFMETMGIDRDRHQWAIYLHFPDHVHLVLNRIDIDGKIWRDSYSHVRAVNACRQAEERFGLTPVTSSPNLEKIKLTRGEAEMEKRTRKPCRKRIVYNAVKRIAPLCSSMDELGAALAEKGISMVITPGRGVSFACGGIAFAGRRISRLCSLRGLQGLIGGAIEAPQEQEGSRAVTDERAPHRTDRPRVDIPRDPGHLEGKATMGPKNPARKGDKARARTVSRGIPMT